MTFVGLAEQVVEETVARKFDELVVRGCLGRLKGDNRRVAGKGLQSPRLRRESDGRDSGNVSGRWRAAC